MLNMRRYDTVNWFHTLEEFYQYPYDQNDIIVFHLCHLTFTKKIVHIVKFFEVANQWYRIIEVMCFESVVCGIVSDPMHIGIPMVLQ